MNLKNFHKDYTFTTYQRKEINWLDIRIIFMKHMMIKRVNNMKANIKLYFFCCNYREI